MVTVSVCILNDITSLCMNVRYADTRTFTPLGVIIQRMRIQCARASEIKIRAWLELEKKLGERSILTQKEGAMLIAKE